MSTTNQPEVLMTVTPVAGAEVKKFMAQEGVDPTVGGLRVSVQPGGCSGFKYGLLIEDAAAEDDLIVDQGQQQLRAGVEGDQEILVGIMTGLNKLAQRVVSALHFVAAHRARNVENDAD